MSDALSSALSAPFDNSAVHWRVQGTPIERNGKWSAMALAYIDARDVMDRLDEVCGPANWQTEYHETAKGRLICRLSIRIGSEWVTKSDGAGDTDVEGEKGAISDALKRAAVSWGIGRYLYRLSSPWVECEVKQSNGKTYWKAWIGDPWAKVKGAPKPAPQAAKPADPEALAIACESLANAESVDALTAIWRDLPASVKSDAAALETAKKRKSELAKEAA